MFSMFLCFIISRFSFLSIPFRNPFQNIGISACFSVHPFFSSIFSSIFYLFFYLSFYPFLSLFASLLHVVSSMIFHPFFIRFLPAEYNKKRTACSNACISSHTLFHPDFSFRQLTLLSYLVVLLFGLTVPSRSSVLPCCLTPRPYLVVSLCCLTLLSYSVSSLRRLHLPPQLIQLLLQAGDPLLQLFNFLRLDDPVRRDLHAILLYRACRNSGSCYIILQRL